MPPLCLNGVHRNKFLSLTDNDPNLQHGIRSALTAAANLKKIRIKRIPESFSDPITTVILSGPKSCVLRSVGKSTLAHGKSPCGKQRGLSQTNRGSQSISTPTLWMKDKRISRTHTHTHTHTHTQSDYLVHHMNPTLEVLRLIPLFCKAYLFQGVFFLKTSSVQLRDEPNLRL